MSIKNLKKLTLFLLTILSFINLNANEKPTPITLQLQWKHQFQFAGFYVAKEKGFYENVGLDVKIKEYENDIDIIDQIDTQKIEFATGRSSLILYPEKDILLLSAIYQSSPFILLAKKRDDIKRLKDIENKTVMISSSLADMASINAMLKAEGITDKNFTLIKHSYDLNDLIDEKVDFMSSYISNEPFSLKQRGVESTIFDPKDYGFDFYGDILYTSSKYAQQNPKIVEKFYKASIKGWKYAFSHIEESVDIIKKSYNSQNRSKEALLYEADILKRLAFKHNTEFGYIDPIRLREISNTYRLLGLDSNTTEDFSSMIYKPLKAQQTNLTKIERSYLEKRDSIKMCIDPDWMPYEKLEDGKYIGMGSDYFKKIESFIKKPIEVIETKNWQESLESGKKRVCDIFSLIAKTPQREKFLNFTDPYFSFPLMIATTMDKPYINKIENITDKKIAIVKGYAYMDFLKSRYPDIDIVEVENLEKGLNAVESGRAFGYIDTMPTLNYEIQKNHIGSLKINGQLNKNWDLCIGVRNDDDLLYQILNKAVKHVDERTRQKIINDWLQTTYDNGYNLHTILKWAGIVAFVLLLLFYKYILSIMHNKKLKESLESFKMLMESTIEGIIIFDKNGLCIQTNKVVPQIYGYDPNEMIGKHALEFVDKKSHQLVKQNMKNKNQEPYEAKMIKKDGTKFYALIRGQDIIWNNKDVRVSSVIDITKIKQLQHDVETLNKNLEEKVKSQVEDIRNKDQLLLQQSKLASMGEMIGAIAHQWRQPLNALNINIQNLDDDFEDGLIDKEFIDRFIEKNSKTIQFMSKTIDQFRNFYRIDKLKEEFSVLESVKSAISIQSAQMKNHNIELTLMGDDFKINGFKNEFQQVVLNIINNAKDAIVEKSIEHGKIEILLDNKSIHIKDNAGGIKESIIDRIFEPYFTTKKQGEGTGIGLYMSKVIIEKNLDGKLTVQNKSNGTMFSIEF